MKFSFTSIALLFSFSLFSQVGIGTTNPSTASALEISGTTNGSAPYKGFMPPRVPSQTERNLINATSLDAGLTVFVESTGTMEIWNGINWETIYTLSTMVTTLAAQDFDFNITWNFTSSPIFYSFPNLPERDVWSIIASFNQASADSEMDNVSGSFLGCRDLNNTNGGGNFDHILSFVNVNVSSVTNPRIAFDYDVFEFDGGDDVSYVVYHDNIAQPTVLLVDGMVGGVSLQGTEIITIPPGITNVRLDLIVNQNGDTDFAGFDQFRVYGQ